MMALFEVLSFKGWLDVRDVLIKALGSVSHHLFDTSIQTTYTIRIVYLVA